MKQSVIALAIIMAAACSATSLAQGAPMRGLGMLASNASTSSGVGNPGSSTLIDPSDGGGSTGARALRGSDGEASHSPRETSPTSLPDVLPTKMAAHSNHLGASTATVAKPVNYRWQSLVPGAIK